MYKVLVVDDQAMPRQLFENIIEHSENYTLAGSISSASMADVYCSAKQVDLVLMDIVMSDGVNGFEAAKRIKSSFPGIKILMVTSMPDSTFIARARETGVDSFWYKEVRDAPLITIMDKTMAGESVYPDSSPTVQLGLANTNEFTNRETDVLRQLTAGYSDKEIANNLGLSYHTVRSHLNSLLQKTGCISRTELAINAAKSGIVVTGI